MIKFSDNFVINEKCITHYKRDVMREATKIKTETRREYVNGSFLKSLLKFDFAKKDVTYYYLGSINFLNCIGNREDLLHLCEEFKWFGKIIGDKIYDFPYITIYLSDGKEYTKHFETDKEMIKVEKMLIRKIEEKNYAEYDNTIRI